MNNLDTKKIILFVVCVIILFIFPIYTIYTNNLVLESGNEFKFKIEAFDPYDMFRGNYLDISFEEANMENYSSDVKEGKCYVNIEEGEDGFAYFSNISNDKPNDTENYYKTVNNKTWNGGRRIDTPSRYYMNENKSLAAENLYNENIESAYVKVKVKNGKMIIVGLYINDILIDELV